MKERPLIRKEVASYVYFETVEQIWKYGEGDLSENEAQKVLDFVSTQFANSHHIDNLPEKLEEYRRTENPLWQVSRNIGKITKTDDIVKLMHQLIDIQGNVIFLLFDGIRWVFGLSETEMADVIDSYVLSSYQARDLALE